MSGTPDRLRRAFELFDQVNASDPRTEVDASGNQGPKELVYARRMSDRLTRFEPGASEELRLAARAQHIARWQIPRSDYPTGRSGYKAWRTRLMRHHAELASECLTEAGYGEEVIGTVSRLLRKQGLKRDPEVQTLEDVVCLVFLEYYFDDFARDHDEEKLIDILRKTWRKMSEQGRSAVEKLDLSDRARKLLTQALEPGR